MKEVKINTLLLAILLNLNSFPAAIGVNGAFIGILVICYILALWGKAYTRNNKGLGIVIASVIFCGISVFFASQGNTYPTKYLLYGVSLGLFIFYIKLKVDSSLIFKYTIILGLLLAPVLLYRATTLSVQLMADDVDTGVMMGLSYAIMPSFLSAFLLVLKHESLLWKLLSFILIIIDLLILVLIGSRGCYVVFLFTIVLFFVHKRFESSNKKVNVLILLGFIGYTILNYLLEILEGLSQILSKFDIEVYALQKMLFMMDHDKVDNGRNELREDVISGFAESPIGHLIGSYEELHDTYTHNIFLQMAWDYGIIGIIFILYIYYISFRFLLRIKTNNEQFDICFVIFSCSMIMLNFSSTYWYIPCFWLWLKFVLNMNRQGGTTPYIYL